MKGTRVLLLLVPLWACAAAAQAPPKLTCQTVLDRGPELAALPAAAQWLPGGHEAAFALDDARIVRRAPGRAEEQAVATAAALAAALGIAVPEGQKPALPAWSFLDAQTLRLVHDDALWHWRIGEAKAERRLRWPKGLVPGEFEAPPLSIAPGDRHAAWILAGDLHVGDAAGQIRRVTWDGGDDVVHGGAAHRAEFGIQRGMSWSGDGRWLAFYREDRRGIDPYPYEDLDATPPAPRHGRYPMAGRRHSRVQVGVYDTESRALQWLERDPDQDLYWTNVTFGADGRSVVVALVTRGQDRLQLARFDCATGRRTATLLEEQDAEWIEPEHGPTFLADGRFLWWSPRDGHRHLWLCDADGKLLVQVTKGAFDVQELLGLAADGQGLWFTASGEDPRQKHLFWAKLDGSEVRQVTRERGTHECSLSADGLFAFDLWSNLETPPSPRFLDLRDGAVEALPAPRSPLADFELPSQRLFQVKTEADQVLYGHVLLPRAIAEGERLPVLLYVYGGPHVQLVTDRWLAGASLWLHALANEGYVVARLDNRGTPNRGIEFEQAIFRRMGVLEVQDQLRAVEWLTQQPFVDPRRIGVHGWSYGGYMTLRLLGLAPGTFACGVSGAPVTDWELYETGFTERYMDTPQENPDGYRASSCLPLAGQLRAPLLIAHGTDDRTVVPVHSLRFVDRCIDEGVLVDYMPYPMQTHRLEGKDRPHFHKLLKDWLDRHLRPAK
jgi:dipeptidyl-peptidase-4